MSLTDLAAVASIISSIAVLATLVYLNIQTRQSDRNQRSMLIQARAANQVDAFLQLADADLAAALVQARSDPANLSAVQLQQYFAQQQAAWLWTQEGYFQHRAKLLDGPAFGAVIAGMKGSLTAPSARAFWGLNRRNYAPEFVAFVEDNMKSTPAAAPRDQLARWKAELAKVDAAQGEKQT